MTSLLDMVKEADLRLRLHRRPEEPDRLRDPGPRRSCGRGCCCACTASAPTPACSAWPALRVRARPTKDLAYVRRRYLSVDALREAIAIVTNGTLRARDPAIWGEGTTACAVRLQALRRLGPEPHDAVARPLRRPRHHDLLARRAEIAVHPLAAQVALLVRGRVA